MLESCSSLRCNNYPAISVQIKCTASTGTSIFRILGAKTQLQNICSNTGTVHRPITQ